MRMARWLSRCEIRLLACWMIVPLFITGSGGKGRRNANVQALQPHGQINGGWPGLRRRGGPTTTTTGPARYGGEPRPISTLYEPPAALEHMGGARRMMRVAGRRRVKMEVSWVGENLERQTYAYEVKIIKPLGMKLAQRRIKSVSGAKLNCVVAIAVEAGSNAEKAGVRVGDRVVATQVRPCGLKARSGSDLNPFSLMGAMPVAHARSQSHCSSQR